LIGYSRKRLVDCHANFFARRYQEIFGGTASVEAFAEPCFCARHAAGGMPNWLMNQRVKELAMA
jgi:hypothetical protein